MSSLNFLRDIKQAARRIGFNKANNNTFVNQKGDGSVPVEWGNHEYINTIGLDNMNRRELRNHLEARDLVTTGTRQELIARLQHSLSEEKLRQFAQVEATMEIDGLVQSDIEERGSVYVCGCNSKGELGLGDTRPRRHFTPIPKLRGIGVSTVIAGVDMCYAITEEHDVYVWGGGGFGRTGLTTKIGKRHHSYNSGHKSSNNHNQIHKQSYNYSHSHNNDDEENWLHPQILSDLMGQECSSICIGLSHCIALGRGGDCFVWGDSDAGQLGMNDFESRPHVTINAFFPALTQISCGANHSAVLYTKGEVYTWGHASNGRLGIGAVERLGVLEAERNCWPSPQHIKTFEPIRQLSCGADHTLALGPSGVWAWGSGSGGKLGLGDTKDRFDPCLIQKLRGKFIIQICAGTWHSMALVGYPPMIGGGWIHTWGSGYHGQLAQGQRQVVLTPEIVEHFVTYHILIKYITTGSHHSAVLSTEGELYTWGSNADGCLGRKINEVDVLFTPIPGFVSGFGTIVGRTGRGLPRSIACGKEFTIVTTYPYTGPDLLVATKLMEEAKIREQETMLAKKAEQQFKDEI